MISGKGYIQKNKIALDQFRAMQIDAPLMGQFIERAGKVFIALAKSKIRVKTGNLRNSIGFIHRDNRGNGKAIRLIGARTYGEYKGFHAHLIEEGTAERSKKRKNKTKADGTKYAPNIGPEKPFMRPAFEQGKSIFIQSMEKQIKDYIEGKAKSSGSKPK
jgi:hypothetical protein